MTTERETEIAKLWADVAMPVQNVILNANLAAREIARHRDRAAWLEVGRGRAEIRAEALRQARTNMRDGTGGRSGLQHPRYRHFHALLMSKAPDLAALEEHDHAGCQHAIWMFENWDAVEGWIAKLTPARNNRLNHLNHPSAIKRRFDAASKPRPPHAETPQQPAPRKDPQIEETAARDAAIIARLTTQLAEAHQKIAELERRNRSLQSPPKGLGLADRNINSKAARQLKALIHPDAAPPEAQAWAHEVFTKIEPILSREAKQEKDAWMSAEEMAKRRQARREANSRRGKEVWAKRKASAQ